MTSRDRLLTTFGHREPDRVPIDLGATQVTGISLEACRNLLKYLNIPFSELQLCDRIQQLCLPPDALLTRLGIDTRGLWPVCSHNMAWTDQEEAGYAGHVDEWGLGYRRHLPDGLWYDLHMSPLGGRDLSPELLDSYPWPEGGESWRVEGQRRQAECFRAAGYAVVLKSLCAGLLEMAVRLRGMENFLTDLMLDRDNAIRLLDRILEIKLSYWDRALSQLGDMVDVVAEGDDYGTQESQLISPALFRQLFRPRLAELVRFIKKRTRSARLFFHSCGNIRPILPDLIEIGIDIINPVQTSARGMEAKALKRDFGQDVVFWGGGIDTQNTLPKGKPQQIRDEVRRNIQILAPGGGFVFNTIHNIQADVPPENIAAMFEAVLEFGR